MQYTFNLNWYDLPSELREEKIDTYIKGNIDSYNANGTITEQEAVDDSGNRNDAEYDIQARFPMYF